MSESASDSAPETLRAGPAALAHQAGLTVREEPTDAEEPTVAEELVRVEEDTLREEDGDEIPAEQGDPLSQDLMAARMEAVKMAAARKEAQARWGAVRRAEGRAVISAKQLEEARAASQAARPHGDQRTWLGQGPPPARAARPRRPPRPPSLLREGLQRCRP